MMGQKGVTIWFTGLSGAGKTTISAYVEKVLLERGCRVESLDGDVVRQSLTEDLGFSKLDREKNIRRVAFVAKLLTRNDVIVLASFISPYRLHRENAYQEIGEVLEVFVDAPLQLCMERDVKGLYAKALAGEILEFTGISDCYESPENPDLTLQTDRLTVEECGEEVIRLLEHRGYL